MFTRNRMILQLVLLFYATFGCSVFSLHFEDGNAAYAVKNFSKAVSEYEAEGHKDAAVYYNLGNSYYQLGELGKAIAAWKKAEIAWPLWKARGELLDNILYVQKKQGLVADSRLSTFAYLAFYVRSLVRSISLFVVQLLFLAMWLLVLLKGWAWYVRGNRLLVAFACMLFVALGSLLAARTLCMREGIVLHDGVSMRAGPGDYRELAVLHAGQEIIMKGVYEEYSKIEVNNLLVGWVPSSEVEMI